ncbi:hypothetical protein ACGC1H_003850 [Rhizoctonia solani]
MLDEFRVASDLLQIALNRYLNACLAIEHSHTKTHLQPGPQNLTGLILVNELPLISTFEAALRQSKITILHSINQSPDLVPISKLPTDILIHIFQKLVDITHGIANFDGKVVSDYPLVLSHVCTHWRQAVFDSPSLWSHVSISPKIKEDRRLLAYANFHKIRTKEGLVDLSIYNTFSSTPEIPGLFEFVGPYFGRIRSLAFGLVMRRSPKCTHKDHGCLLAGGLKSSNGRLKRLIVKIWLLESWGGPSDRLQWFMESSSNPPDHMSLRLDLPHEHLEAMLHPISELYLEGLSFKWTSKAYHGLTTLRLGRFYQGLTSIPESQLRNILTSSPQLQWLSVDLDISQTTTSPDPVYMPYLRALIVQDMSILRLIQPGSDELTLSILSDKLLNPTKGETFDDSLLNFFSRANITKFHSNGLLHEISDARYLLSVAPRIQVLSLYYLICPDSSVDMLSDSSGSLKELILNECEVELSELRRMIQLYQIEKLVLCDSVNTPNGEVLSPDQVIVSDSDKTVVHYVSLKDMSLLLGQFLGPVY